MKEKRLKPIKVNSPATSTRGCPPKPAAPALPPPVSGPRIDQVGWRHVLDLVRTHRPALAGLLERAAVMRFDSECVTLGYKLDSILVGMAAEASAQNHLRKALEVHFGRMPDLAFETIAGEKPEAPKPRREPRGPRL